MGSFWSKFFSGERKEFDICIAGLDNSGKSTLAHQLSGSQRISESYAPTMGIDIKRYTSDNISYTVNILAPFLTIIQIFDVGGSTRFREHWSRFIARVDAVIFVVDSTDDKRFPEACDALTKIQAEIANKPVLIVSNKIDLPNHKSLSEVQTALTPALRADMDFIIMEISSLKKTRFDRLMSWLTSHANESTPK